MSTQGRWKAERRENKRSGALGYSHFWSNPSLHNLALPSQHLMGRKERAKFQEIGWGEIATAPFGMWGWVAVIVSTEQWCETLGSRVVVIVPIPLWPLTSLGRVAGTCSSPSFSQLAAPTPVPYRCASTPASAVALGVSAIPLSASVSLSFPIPISVTPIPLSFPVPLSLPAVLSSLLPF